MESLKKKLRKNPSKKRSTNRSVKVVDEEEKDNLRGATVVGLGDVRKALK